MAWTTAALIGIWLGLAGVPALAQQVLVRIDISDQKMHVTRDGLLLHVWSVSTARPGKVTPLGTYQPQTLVRFHRSTIYDGAAMPWSIFFRGNYAIHGTTQISRLGQPASAGCVRLHPDNAERLYEMVRVVGKADVVIEIVE